MGLDNRAEFMLDVGGRSPRHPLMKRYFAKDDSEEMCTMEKTALLVPSISWGHCVMTIQRALGETERVYRVEEDRKTKEITVQWDAPATLEKIKSTLMEINYPAAESLEGEDAELVARKAEIVNQTSKFLKGILFI